MSSAEKNKRGQATFFFRHVFFFGKKKKFFCRFYVGFGCPKASELSDNRVELCVTPRKVIKYRFSEQHPNFRPKLLYPTTKIRKTRPPYSDVLELRFLGLNYAPGCQIYRKIIGKYVRSRGAAAKKNF